MPKQENVKKPIYKKWWAWVLVLLVLGAVATQGEEEAEQDEKIPVVAPEKQKTEEIKTEVKPKVEKAKEEKPKAEEKPKEEVIIITALDLYNAYDENEVSADLKYRDKQLEVTGKVKDIGKDIFDKIYVTLDVGAVIGSVYLSFEKGQEDKIAGLKKGQSLTVVGKGGGFSALSVTIKNSRIQ